MPKMSGVELEEAWGRRVDVRIDDGLSVPFISREDLLTSKRAAARVQDLADVDALRENNPNRCTEKDQDAEPKDQPRKLDKGLDDDLNS